MRSWIACAAILAIGAGCKSGRAGGADAAVDLPDGGCEAGRQAKLDILFVVDDSGSMCQEQVALASNLRRLLSVFRREPGVDVRLAVTTTNVCWPATVQDPQTREFKTTPCTSSDECNGSECKAGTQWGQVCMQAGAVRGRFVYQPAFATSARPDCEESRTLPCTANDDDSIDTCRTHPELPDAQNWRCERKDNRWIYSCDRPADAGPDDWPGDVLFVVNTSCRYSCAREWPNATGADEPNPGDCARLFGQAADCGATCASSGACDASACESAADCDASCAGGACDVAKCKADRSAACGSVCASDWDCRKKCEAWLYDPDRCAQVCSAGPADCFGTCADQKTGLFPYQDLGCFLTCDTTYRCSDRCVEEFGSSTYRCTYPGGDKTQAGCLRFPPTAYCPADGPTVLDQDVASHYYDLWKNRAWTGDPAWRGMDEATVRQRLFEQLAACMTSVGDLQTPCGMQEQGLEAAWLALDPDGENAGQAKAFLRPDANLLVVVMSTQDDCSTSARLTQGVYGQCPCMADANGCKPDGTCGDAAGHLIPTWRYAARFKSLKTDPSMVSFAAIVGEEILGSSTSPGSDAAEVRKRYFDCKCEVPGNPYTPLTYVCTSEWGRAELGSRYLDVARALGPGDGLRANICDPAGFGASLERIATAAVPPPTGCAADAP